MRNSFILIGMPGSGKTELGLGAADLIGKPFIDLDKEITQKTGHSPREIITRDGESAFRKIETTLLSDYADFNGVLSTGGGIVTVPENLYLLRKIGMIIWIKRDIDAIADSVSYSNDRPLLRDRSSVDTLWEARKDLYESWADAVFENTDNKSEAAAGLASLIRSMI